MKPEFSSRPGPALGASSIPRKTLSLIGPVFGKRITPQGIAAVRSGAEGPQRDGCITMALRINVVNYRHRLEPEKGRPKPPELSASGQAVARSPGSPRAASACRGCILAGARTGAVVLPYAARLATLAIPGLTAIAHVKLLRLAARNQAVRRRR